MTLRAAIGAMAMVLTAFSAWADDPWELDPEEDGQATRAHILPGQQQIRDLQGGPGTPDEDWTWIVPVARHSYQARATGAALWSGLAGYAKLERVSSGLTVLATGTDEDVASFRGHTLRWIAGSTSDHEYLRVTGAPGVAQTAAPYTLELFDTTYAIPRWNSTGTQNTILIIQNNKTSPVTGSIYFYGSSGNLVHTAALSVPANGAQLVSTNTIPQLAGQSGVAHVAHTGGRGALSGKAVALEPATGFTFDTAMTPVQP